MGIELLEIGIKVKNGVIFTIRGGFRSVCNHAFFVGMLCFLVLLYRSSPFIFSLLVSTSPILVCTAVLLGVLLSYGQPNIPEIEIEEKTTFEVVSIKTGVSSDAAAVVEKNDSYYVERFSEADQSTEHPDISAPLIEERLREAESSHGEIWEENRGIDGLRYKNKSEWLEERLDEANNESDDEKSEADSFDSERVNVDSLDSPPRSPWTRFEERENEGEEEEKQDDEDEEKEEKEEEDEEEDGEEDDDSDSGSSRAESSSPDASMADIMPMLDELHPLLEAESLQPVIISRGGSDVASEKSRISSTATHESDDETENHEDLEVADDENEDDEDAPGDKEEQTKSAITWTEEDQKNLMDLGSSEIERNQRLENLIMRRKARKNLSSLAERNLIDFESSDLPFNIAPVLTRRQNPFDTPHDSYYDVGLPPIPGSAPSILLPRRNPFDIPYDSSEEKPNLVGDGFQEEFTSQPRDASIFRRHESFNARPSVFAPNRARMRPFFVPEGAVSEESSYSRFERQLSELSESKVSSVPETESISSLADLEERKLSEEDNLLEVEPIMWTNEVSEEGQSLEPELISQQEELNEEDENQEPEMMSSKIECVSEHVGHGSQSSEEEEEEDLKRDVEHRYNSSDYSRSSSLSEVSERVFIDTEGDERISVFDGRGDGIAEEISAEDTDFRVADTLLVDDVQPREPVYDSSPRGVSRNISSSSISCDVNNSESVSSTAYPVDESRTVHVIYNDGVNHLFSGVDESSESSGADKNIHTSFESSEYQNLDKVREQHVIGRDRGIEVTESQVEDQLSEEDIIGMEETVQSPNSAEEGNTSLFYDKPVLEPTVEHLSEMQEPSTTVESSRDFLASPKLNMNMPEVQELDYGISSDANSSLNAEFISITTSATETTSSRVDDVQTIVEEALEFEEFDEELLSELDNVGDFSAIRAVEANSFEHSKIEDALHAEISRENIEEKTDYISEPQTSETVRAEHTEREFNEMDAQDSPDQETSSEDKTLLSEEENDVQLITPTIVNHSYEDENPVVAEPQVSVVTEPKVGSAEDGDSVSEKAELVTSAETAVVVDDDVIYRGQVDSISEENDFMTSAETVIVDSSTVEDIDLAFKQICDTDIEKTVIFEPPQAELIVPETIYEQSENGPLNTNSSELGSIHDTSILEFRQAEDAATMDYKQLNESSADEVHSTMHVVEGPVPSEDTSLPPKQVLNVEALEKRETNSDDGSVQVTANEVGSSVELLSKKEINVVVAGDDVIFRGQDDSISENDLMTSAETVIVDSGTVVDIDLALKQISDRDIEKTILFEPPQAELIVRELITEQSENGPPSTNSSEMGPPHETSILEFRQAEDATNMDYKQLKESSSDEDHHTTHVVESAETLGRSPEFHVVGPIPSEDTNFPPNQVFDVEALEKREPNADDGSLQVKANEVGPSLELSSTKEINVVVAAETPGKEIEAPNKTTSVKGKGKVSKSSSSSSSSSSESSSSDSDKE